METLPAVPHLTPIGKLAEALSKAQKDFKVPKKTQKVDFTDKNGRRVKYNYADLADCIEAVREPLAANGLAITHKLGYQGQIFGMITTLMHSSGESIDSFYPLPDPYHVSIKPQEFGGALTYGRRYTLTALTGIASEEDIDGAGDDNATTPPSKAESKAQSKPAAAKKSDPSPKEATPPKNPERDLKVASLKTAMGEHSIDHEALKALIRLATGQDKHTTALTIAEIDKVIDLIKLSVQK